MGWLFLLKLSFRSLEGRVSRLQSCFNIIFFTVWLANVTVLCVNTNQATGTW